ncbi:hypothetical protein Hanom_Chr17g01583281 [Helianthus anomalus]
MNFISKGTFDPNGSFTCADKVVGVKFGDILGDEQDFNSDFSRTSFDKTYFGCVFGQVFLDAFHTYVSSSGPDVLGKTVDACDEPLNNVSDDGCFSVNNCDCDISKSTADVSVTGEVPRDAFSETVLVDVPNVESSETPLETVVENEPKVNSYDTCVDETCVDETSTCSEIKT